MLVGDILKKSAARAPERLALIGRGRRLTYAEFEQAANRLAHALLGLKLEKGANVAILSSNRPEYAIAYFAIARTPYVSAHLSTRSIASELEYVLNRIDAKVIFFEASHANLITEILPQLETRPLLIALDKTSDIDGATFIDDFAAGFPGGQPEIDIEETDSLAITLTGGTTGLPKAVLVSHRARSASAIAAKEEFGLDADDIVIASTPLFHAAGLFVWFGTAVMQGATVVLPPAWDAAEFMKIVESEKVTAAFLVPSQLNDLISHRDFSAEKLKTLKNIGFAGAPMSRALFDRVQSLLPHVAFTENYGQSEACPITIRPPGVTDEKLGTVGKAACNAEIGIVDTNGNLLPAGEIGDVVTRGDQLFDEYLNDPEETKAAFSLDGGWLLTGDVGFIDDDGFLTLVDRSKDMLVSGGENVYPAEIENVLYQHEAVAECAVFGIPDERWGEVPAAHIVLSPGVSVSEKNLIDFCATKIARFKRPRIVKFVNMLPKTPVGKIRKNDLRQPYWSDKKKNV
ncbi:MAG: AMP-binding protein [Woeseiaceae bacterium]|nr:AMP-binding protein [Woeseiaceae bacterium]